MLRFLSNRPGAARRAPRPAFRPRLEALEARCVPTVLTVNNVSGDDQVAGSLPYTVRVAQSGDTIQFDTRGAFAKPVTVTLGHEFDITKRLTIAGPGQNLLTVTGFSGAFFVEKGGNLTLTDLTLSGFDGGPVVENYQAALTLRNCAVRDNTLRAPLAAVANLGGQARLTVEHCTVARNQHAYGGGTGGGIYNEGALTVRDSTITDNSAEVGGGIYNTGHTRLNVRPTVLSTTVSANHATQDGGGIYDKGDLLVDDGCRVTDNTAGQNGGGVYLPFRAGTDPDNTLTVCASTVSGNHATNGRGGGVYADSGALIHDSTVSDNAALHDGGGVFVGRDGSVGVISSTLERNATWDSGGGVFADTAFVTLSFCTIRGNTALVSGGGVFAGVPTGGDDGLVPLMPPGSRALEISYCTLADNYAGWNGGGLGVVNFQDGDVALQNSTVAHNLADNQGGGVYVYTSELRALNSTIAFNQAGAGGGVYNYYGNASLESVTVAGNSVQGTGGGVDTAVDPAFSNTGTTTLKNTIVAGNHSITYPFGIPAENDVAGPIQTAFSNLIQSTAGATITAAPGAAGPGLTISVGSHSLRDIYGVDPRLGPLQDNGGPTQTMALLPGSPAVGAGDPTNAPRIDQRGLTRAGGGFDDSAIDIGAYATQTTGSPAVEPVIDCDGSSVATVISRLPPPASQPGIALTPPSFPGGGPRPVGGVGASVTVIAAARTTAGPVPLAFAPAAATPQPAALGARAVDLHFSSAAPAPALRTAVGSPRLTAQVVWWTRARLMRPAGVTLALDEVFAESPAL